MKELRLEETGKAIVIVAHPDDETIWMGGVILNYPKIDWTIFCLCRASDTDRAPKFRKVCAAYGARAIIRDLDDEGRLALSEMIPQIKQILKGGVGGRKFDYLFTHGPNGEYGHRIHRGVHRAVKEVLAAGIIGSDKKFCFSYRKKGRRPQAGVKLKKGTEFFAKLAKAGFADKKKIMTDVYGFDPKGIDVSFCLNKEGFTALHNK